MKFNHNSDIKFFPKARTQNSIQWYSLSFLSWSEIWLLQIGKNCCNLSSLLASLNQTPLNQMYSHPEVRALFLSQITQTKNQNFCCIFSEKFADTLIKMQSVLHSSLVTVFWQCCSVKEDLEHLCCPRSVIFKFIQMHTVILLAFFKVFSEHVFSFSAEIWKSKQSDETCNYVPFTWKKKKKLDPHLNSRRTLCWNKAFICPALKSPAQMLMSLTTSINKIRTTTSLLI